MSLHLHTIFHVALLILLHVPAACSGQTKIWINTVSGYSALASCAEHPLSTIVRDMQQGCGDDSQLTSYTCFCTASSSAMRAIISRDVAAECGGSSNGSEYTATSLPSWMLPPASQASSAMAVFDAYCALGLGAADVVTNSAASATATPTTITTTASPAGGTAVASATGTASSQSSSSPSRLNTATITVSVVVPVLAVALSICAFLLYRSRRTGRGEDGSTTAGGSEEKGSVELKTEERVVFQELDGAVLNEAAMQELAGDTMQQPEEAATEAEPVEKYGEPVVSELEGGQASEYR